jgi:hypothetical protein
MKTIESVVLLRSKVEQLNVELSATNRKVDQIVGTIVQMNGRLIRLETFEEVRTGVRPPLQIE